MLATIVFVNQSCKKEEATVQKQESNSSATLGAQGGGIDITEAKIVKFFNRMNLVRKDPKYSESENWNYSADSAVWYIEASLNYKYSYNWQYAGDEKHSDLYNLDSSFTTVNSNNGEEYNILDLQFSYDALSEELEIQYSNITAESKFFVLSDIVKLGSENGNLQLLQYSVIGLANKYFTSGDWKWGMGLGDCSGNHLGLDATDIIENKLSMQRAVQANTEFVNVNSLSNNNGWIWPNDVPLPSGQNNPTIFWNNLIFNYTNQFGDPCLTNSDMNWYKDNVLDIEQTNSPSGKVIVFTDVLPDISVGPNSSNIIHLIKPYYGEPHNYSHDAPID